MPKMPVTKLICYDDHRSFSDDVRNRFSDKAQYEVVSFHTKQDFTDYFKRDTDGKACKIAIIGVPDTREQFESIDDLTMEIKRISHDTGLILVVPPDKMEDLRKTVRFNIDSYIPRNLNMVLRLHNAVKKIISEHHIKEFRLRRNISVWILAGFILLSAVTLIISFLRLPDYF
jgi:hypothetical protein